MAAPDLSYAYPLDYSSYTHLQRDSAVLSFRSFFDYPSGHRSIIFWAVILLFSRLLANYSSTILSISF
jgi:hypothetical protein